ncbi:hypothetical protein Tco_1306394, partial [Tanacetum coccineum]
TPPRRLKKKSIKTLVEKRVAKAIEKYEKSRANLDSAESSGGNPWNAGGTMNVHGYSHKTFMNGKPDKYGSFKNHKKTVKNGQARTRERKSAQKPEAKPKKSQPSVKQSKEIKTSGKTWALFTHRPHLSPRVNQGASLNQGSKRTIQELVNKMAGIDQSNQRISLAHSQAQATCDEEKAQRDVGFALNTLSKQTQLSLKRIATLAIRVSSLVIQRWTRRNQ